MNAGVATYKAHTATRGAFVPDLYIHRRRFTNGDTMGGSAVVHGRVVGLRMVPVHPVCSGESIRPAHPMWYGDGTQKGRHRMCHPRRSRRPTNRCLPYPLGLEISH